MIDRSDTPKYIDALTDEDISVRTSAIDMLAKIGDERALKSLFYIACFDEDEGQMIDMGEYGLRTFPLRDKAREALNQIILKEGESAIEPLLELLVDNNPDYRKTAADLLGSINSDKAIRPLIKAMHDPMREIQMQAYLALRKIRHPDSIEPLIAFMPSQSPEVRKDIVELLGFIKDKRAADPLAEIVNNDPDIEVQIEAAWALHEMGDDRGLIFINSLVDELLRVYHYPRYPGVYENDFNSLKRITLIGYAFLRFGGITFMNRAYKQFKKTVQTTHSTIYLDLAKRWEGIGGWSATSNTK